MNVAIILAGGRGTRVGADVPKQFIEVLGRPVLSYTIERFQNHPEVDAIEVVCRKGYEDELRAICDAGGFDKVPALLAALRGGYVNAREESIYPAAIQDSSGQWLNGAMRGTPLSSKTPPIPTPCCPSRKRAPGS